MEEFSNMAGCAIEPDFIYLARRYDAYDVSVPFTRMSFHDQQDQVAPWRAHDLKWRTVSVCVWRGGLDFLRLYVALSTEGDVELTGPLGNPTILERIAGAGMAGPDARKQGFMARIRQVGESLYACGSGYLTFRRNGAGWIELSGPRDQDATILQGYLDINGHGENEVFAVGPDSSSTSRVSVYDGATWHSLLDGHPDTLTSIAVSRNGGVFIGGWNGLLHVNSRSEISTVLRQENVLISDMVEYGSQLYLATTNGLYVLQSQAVLARVETGHPSDGAMVSHLDNVGGVLWAFGPKVIISFDGTTWTHVPDPDR